MAAATERAPARLRKEWLRNKDVITGFIETHLRALNLNDANTALLKGALEEAIFLKADPEGKIRKKAEIQRGLKEYLAPLFSVTLPQVKLAIAKLFRKPAMPVALKRMEKADVPVTYSRLKSQLRVMSMSRSQVSATAGPTCSVDAHRTLEQRCTTLEAENKALRDRVAELEANAQREEVGTADVDLRGKLRKAVAKIERQKQFVHLAIEERQRVDQALSDVFGVQKQPVPFVWWLVLLSEETKKGVLDQWTFGAPLKVHEKLTENRGASGEVKLIGSYAAKCMSVTQNLGTPEWNGQYSAHSVKSLERCINEANLTYRYRHKNIMPTFIRCFDENFLYEVMPCMKYGDLQSLLNAGGRMHPEACAYVMHETLRGLEYVHVEMEQIHRDVKLQNILVGSKGSIRVADLGFCGSIGQEHLTCLGTSWYMSPELACNFLYGGVFYERSVDVWAVGVCTYVLVVGEEPHYALNYLNDQMTSDQQNRMVLEEVGRYAHGFRARLEARLQSVAPECRDFILSCMSLDPANRPSVKQLLQHPFIQQMSAEMWGDYYTIAQHRIRKNKPTSSATGH